MTEITLNRNEEQIIRMLQKHFFNLRQRQKQDIDITSLTDDLRFTLTFVNDSVMHPVPLLKKMGILVAKYGKQNKKLVGIHYQILQKHLFLPRTRTISSLHREGWKDADEKQRTVFIPFVGINFLKEWSILIYPEDTDLSRYIAENARLIASEELLQPKNANKNVDDILNNAGDQRFPLVAIQYEREFANFDLANYPPLNFGEKQNQKTNLGIVKGDTFEFVIGGKLEKVQT
ncbi:hypothetical protein TRFO_27675 [Tritrichomonas foetus]|uniref:Initiator binding domain-containing protein n=1 Tax=Tritrichomonas foetus TaxID=1144522 RepID=A0A1J4K1H4_9EUKA|nr:hypothetical protein TRFO_27675 [Tritrichomonas foetus]|eukprot:OHT04810.1 hypothetical protein TRFO_27675 [Tritrichomonas foetus]